MHTILYTTRSYHHRLIALLTILITALLASLSIQIFPVYAAKQTHVRENSPYQKLIWSDEFNGAANQLPNPNTWSAEIGGGNHGWGNQQMDYDTNSNAYQDGNGNLVLEARQENPAHYQCWYGTCQYTSARLNTNTHFSVQYGRIEARIKVSRGQGLWSAFWLVGTNIATVGWPACGEIDAMENIGRTPNTIYGTIHGPNLSGSDSYGFGGTSTLPNAQFADDYHVFAVQWDSSQVSFLVDNVTYSTITKANALQRNGQWVFDHPFYLILDNAVGGSWPQNPDQTTVFPQKMYVDYVRVYQ